MSIHKAHFHGAAMLSDVILCKSGWIILNEFPSQSSAFKCCSNTFFQVGSRKNPSSEVCERSIHYIKAPRREEKVKL
ncbi:hypothetical protein LDENG_00169720, partial [Lucifuga dentata]